MIIARGRILADGTPAELKARSSTGNMDEVFREITLGAARPVETSDA
jgi:ABC-2 type transport system ATP-binding protein